MNDKAIFVKIDKHEEIQTVIKTIRLKTKEAKDKIQKIRDLDKEETVKLAEFDQAIEHINANLDQIGNYMKQ
jgi:hypothetical protein